MLRRLVVLPLLTLALIAGAGQGPGIRLAADGRAVASPPSAPPNIVLVMADDMAASDLRWMPRTRRLLGGRGLRFTQGLAPNPMCCPARASVLTGQESHGNGVWSNGGARGGYAALPGTTRLPFWLQEAGYRTAFLGKHLNGYKPAEFGEEPGWDVHDPLVRGTYSYRTFTSWDDGALHKVRRGYVTDHLRRQSVAALDRFEKDDDTPFFLWVAHVGVHNSRQRRCPDGGCWNPPVPAKQDRGSFAGVRSPSRDEDSYNHRNGEDKPSFLRERRRVSGTYVDELFQRRAETLQAMDRSVAATVRGLRQRGELARTLFVFTSDQGYLLGQHRYIGKRLPYEESLRVPLLVRGPGVRAGATAHLATSVDLTSTFVDIAGARAPYALDGASLVPTLRDPAAAPPRAGTIIQTGAHAADDGDRTDLPEELPDRGWLYRGYRDDRYTYAGYPHDVTGSGFEELYDRDRDPAQLDNVAGDPEYASVLQEARSRARLLWGCSGESCHPDWPPLPEPAS